MNPSSYRNDIDGLRAIAVSAVVLYHAFPKLAPGGFVGVDVFFVISGYLISGILLNELKNDSFSLTNFYARRIRRIFPALTLVLCTCYVFGWFSLYADEYKKLGKHIYHGAAFVSNFAFWHEGGYFDQAAETKPLNHLWSLGIEEQFYIVWPLILWAAWKIWRKPLLLAIGILVGSFVFNIYISQTDTIADFYSPLTRVWELLIGAALSFCSTTVGVERSTPEPAHRTMSFPNWPAKRILFTTGSTVGFMLILVSIWTFDKTDAYPGWRALVPTIGAALILAGSGSWFNRTVLSLGPVRWVGLISYSLYLWHWPLLAFARVVHPNLSVLAIMGLVSLGVLLAHLTYVLVEAPVRRWKPRSFKVRLLLAPLTLIGLIGYNAYARDGLDFREVSLTYYLGKIKTSFFDDATSAANPGSGRVGYQDRLGLQSDLTKAQSQNLNKLANMMKSSSAFFKTLEADPQSGHLVQERDLDRENCQSLQHKACSHPALQGMRIVIVGDSHAGNMAKVFAYAYPAVNFVEFIGTGCTPISQRYTEESNRCGTLIRQALDYSRQNHPDAVIFVARWPLDFEPIGKDVEAFGKYARKLIIVGPGPEFTADPSHFLLRYSEGDAVQYVNSFLLQSQFDKNQRMKSFSEKIGVEFIDRVYYYCSQSFCPLTSTGEDLLIYDSNHLTRSGSVYLGTILSNAGVLENVFTRQ